MKPLSAILGLVLVMHLQCGSLCLTDSFRPPANEQPCHKHSGAPARTPQQPHETSSRCGQGSLIEAKTAVGGKHVLMVVVAVIPIPPTIVRSGETFVPSLRKENLPPADFPFTAAVLRI
jgi:hypothetical protein